MDEFDSAHTNLLRLTQSIPAFHPQFQDRQQRRWRGYPRAPRGSALHRTARLSATGTSTAQRHAGGHHDRQNHSRPSGMAEVDVVPRRTSLTKKSFRSRHCMKIRKSGRPKPTATADYHTYTRRSNLSLILERQCHARRVSNACAGSRAVRACTAPCPLRACTLAPR